MKTYFVRNKRNIKNTTSRIAMTLVLGTGLVIGGGNVQSAGAQVGRGGVTVAPVVPHVSAPTAVGAQPMPRMVGPVLTTVHPSIVPSIYAPGFGRLGIATPFQNTLPTTLPTTLPNNSAFRNQRAGADMSQPSTAQGRPILPPVPFTGRITEATPAAVNNILSNSTSSNGARSSSNGSYQYHNTAESKNYGFHNTTGAKDYRFGVQHGNRYYYGDYYGFGYFPGSLAYSSLYAPYFANDFTFLSPYAFYSSALPPYIMQGGTLTSPPPYAYVPYPVYQNGIYQGTQDQENSDVDNYYLNQNRDKSQKTGKAADSAANNGESGKNAALDRTVGDLQNAWTRGKLDLLAKHVQRDIRISVFLRGKYQYSLESGDYLDMTRDALAATKTVRFELDKIQRQSNDMYNTIYTVTGRHIYRDKNVTSVPGDITAPDPNAEHTVYVTYVLQKIGNDYIITQVGTAPDRVEE